MHLCNRRRARYRFFSRPGPEQDCAHWIPWGQQSRIESAQGLEDGLGELGYLKGKNVEIAVRHGEGKSALLPSAAADLVRSSVDIIVTGTNPATSAAKQATSSIPIVMTVGTGVVQAGFATSLARPDGNVIGLALDVDVEWIGKRLQLLKEAVPGMSRPSVLYEPRA